MGQVAPTLLEGSLDTVQPLEKFGSFLKRNAQPPRNAATALYSEQPKSRNPPRCPSTGEGLNRVGSGRAPIPKGYRLHDSIDLTRSLRMKNRQHGEHSGGCQGCGGRKEVGAAPKRHGEGSCGMQKCCVLRVSMSGSWLGRVPRDVAIVGNWAKGT